MKAKTRHTHKVTELHSINYFVQHKQSALKADSISSVVRVTNGIQVCINIFNRHKKVDNKRHYYKQPHIIILTSDEWWGITKKVRPVVYLDEIWANAHNGKDCARVQKDEVTGGLEINFSQPNSLIVMDNASYIVVSPYL